MSGNRADPDAFFAKDSVIFSILNEETAGDPRMISIRNVPIKY